LISQQGKAYLDQLYNNLRNLPEEDRLDAVREIESHITDGIRSGEAEGAILAKLGNPRQLAKAYRSEFIVQMKPSSIKDILAMISFYCTTGLLSVFVVPILATIAYGFGFCAVLTLLGGIIRTFGVTWITMDLGPNYSVPAAWSMLYALIVGGIIGSIAYFSWKYLKIYLAYLSSRYRSMLETRIR
jgi:uncharacterized membrane protein